MPDEEKSIIFKGRKMFPIARCWGTIVETPDGKRHFESECPDKEARDELKAILEEEAVLRVTPKVALEETPVETPVETPEVKG